MIHLIPGSCRGSPKLLAVGQEASVKPVVHGSIILPQVVILVQVEQLVDGEVASYA